MDYARALRSSTKRIAGSGYEIVKYFDSLANLHNLIMETDFQGNG